MASAKNKENKHMSKIEETVEKFASYVDSAVEEFGRYDFSDKGPHEVLDQSLCLEMLQKLSTDEQVSVLATMKIQKQNSYEMKILAECLEADLNEFFETEEEVDKFCDAVQAAGEKAREEQEKNKYASLPAKTFKDLKKILNGFTEEQLDNDVSIFLSGPGEYCSIRSVSFAVKDESVLDVGHPYIDMND